MTGACPIAGPKRLMFPVSGPPGMKDIGVRSKRQPACVLEREPGSARLLKKARPEWMNKNTERSQRVS